MPRGAHTGAAGGTACGDVIRISLCVDLDRITTVGFDAVGCASTAASGSAVVSLIEGSTVIDAARIGEREIADELGGLAPGAQHAASLAADALHRALGAAVRDDVTLAPVAGRRIVAMSGGVDSTVAALLTGSRAIAVTLELWSDPANDGQRSCCSPQAVRAARTIAHGLGLPHLSIDLRSAFRAGVVEPWLAAHAAGETPNPCVRCNGTVRLDAMVDLTERLGGEALVTGHYARVGDGLLRVAVDSEKDQSYMLAALDPGTLDQLRFPLGELRKEQVRELARRCGLDVAGAPESQDLCFLAGTSRAAFLARHGGLEDREGAVENGDAQVLGRHRGVHHFTVGQRRGVGVGGGTPLYVLATDADRNTVTVGPREALATRKVSLRDAVLHRPAFDSVRLRYRQPPLACARENVVSDAGGSIEITLADPAYGVAPGQLACLMAGELVVGHATIARPPRSPPSG